MAIPRMKPRKQHQTEEEKQAPTNKVFLPYIKGVMDRMGKLLKKHSLQILHHKYYSQQRTKGSPSPLQEYTGYLAVVDRYTVVHRKTGAPLSTNPHYDKIFECGNFVVR